MFYGPKLSCYSHLSRWLQTWAVDELVWQSGQDITDPTKRC
jgi:hypothetical protein